jgi:hypothetical protein
MPTMHLVASGNPTRLSALNAGVRRVARSAAARTLTILRSLWNEAFPTPPFDRPPGTPAPIAKAAALREPALLSEMTDAVAKKRSRVDARNTPIVRRTNRGR